MLSGGDRWYLVQSLARREASAELQLVAQKVPGLSTLGGQDDLPRATASPGQGTRFSGLSVRHSRPWPRSVAFDQWNLRRGPSGYRRRPPVTGTSGLVEAMIERTDTVGETHLSYPFSLGQSVRVTTGPFAQLVGTLDRLDAGGRVRVLLDIMGGTIPVQLLSDPRTDDPAIPCRCDYVLAGLIE